MVGTPYQSVCPANFDAAQNYIPDLGSNLVLIPEMP